MASAAEIERAAVLDPALAAALARDRTEGAQGDETDELTAAELTAVRGSSSPSRGGASSRRSPLTSPQGTLQLASVSGEWGKSWTPQYPVEEQLVRETTELLKEKERELVRRRLTLNLDDDAEVEDDLLKPGPRKPMQQRQHRAQPLPHRQGVKEQETNLRCKKEQDRKRWKDMIQQQRRQRPKAATSQAQEEEEAQEQDGQPSPPAPPPQEQRQPSPAAPPAMRRTAPGPYAQETARSSAPVEVQQLTKRTARPAKEWMNTALTWSASVPALHKGKTDATRYAHLTGCSTPVWRQEMGALALPQPEGVARRAPRYEPAKITGADGKMRLHGVKSTSDVARYLKDVDVLTRDGWKARETYKTMRAEQHRATSESTWRALHSWIASEKSIDRFYAGQCARGTGARSSEH